MELQTLDHSKVLSGCIIWSYSINRVERQLKIDELVGRSIVVYIRGGITLDDPVKFLDVIHKRRQKLNR